MPPKAFLGDEDAGERESIRPFDFELAERLRCTVRELGERIDEREYLHWHRYFQVKAQSQEMAIAEAEARGRR